MATLTAPQTASIKTNKFNTPRLIVVTQSFHLYGCGNKKWDVTVNGAAVNHVVRFGYKRYGTTNNPARFATLAEAVAALTITLTAKQQAVINAIAA